MKKFLSLMLIALALVLALTSCFGNEEESPTTTTPTTTTTTQQITPEPPVHEHLYNEFVTAPTCTEQGYTTYTCDCGDSYVDDYVDALGHNPAEAVEENRVEATCHAEGNYDNVIYCSKCNAELERTSYTLAKIEHTPADAVEENRVEPTHEKDGSYQMVVYCLVAECHAELERTTHIIDMLVHHPSDVVIENNVEATCTANGSYDEVVYCLDDDCGHKELSRKTISIPMISHIPAEVVEENRVDETCTTNGSYDEVVYCANCSSQISRTTKVIEATGHSFSEWIIDSKPTTTTEGSKHIECTVCGETIKTEVIEKLKASEGLEYIRNDDGESYSVTGIGTCTDTYIIISSTYNGLPVTSIGEQAFYKCKFLTSIKIPDSVTSIGKAAFYGCESLTSVTISDSVTSIGRYAFNVCDSLTSVTIGNSVTIDGEAPFYDCPSLTSIEVNPNNQHYKSIDGNLYTKDGKTLIRYAIGKEATSFTIPNSVTSIGDRAFAGCDSLTSVTIPNPVTSIGDFAFADCYSLASVTIGNSVTSIGDSAFSFCRSLTSIEIPDSVTSIGDFAFSSCYLLIEVINKSSLNIVAGSYDYGNIGYYAKHIITDESQSALKTVGDYIFYDDGTDIYLVKYIGSDTEITLPKYEGGKEYGILNYAFLGCESLTSITIPDSVTSIGDFAFADCTSLKSIVIPYSVTSIGKKVFWYCESLTIYCEAESKPSVWSDDWNRYSSASYGKNPVIWDYKNK